MRIRHNIFTSPMKEINYELLEDSMKKMDLAFSMGGVILFLEN